VAFRVEERHCVLPHEIVRCPAPHTSAIEVGDHVACRQHLAGGKHHCANIREVAAERGGHRLVDAAQPALDVALAREGHSKCAEAAPLEVAITLLAPERERALDEPDRLRRTRGVSRLGEPEPAENGLGGRIGGQSFGASQPASAGDTVPERHVVLDAQLDALGGSAEHITPFAQECVSTLATGNASRISPNQRRASARPTSASGVSSVASASSKAARASSHRPARWAARPASISCCAFIAAKYDIDCEVLGAKPEMGPAMGHLPDPLPVHRADPLVHRQVR